MQKISPYLRLMRLHQPVGIWLVFWPCAWAIALSGLDYLHLLLPFFAGSVLMRGLGCVLNDMADREFDKHVERTKNRPLASGELSLKQAFGFGCILAILTLGVAGWLYERTSPSLDALVRLCSITLAMVAAYPFMKRITWWPQLFLGLTFNLGVFFVALVTWQFGDFRFYWLYAACIFWTLGYDTIYGFMDQKDDEKIGVKSTSRKLSAHGGMWIAWFYGMCTLCAAFSMPMALVPMIPHFAWQIQQLNASDPALCLRIFKSNAWLGALVFLVVLASHSFPALSAPL